MDLDIVFTPSEFMDNLWEKLEERMNQLQEEEHFGGLDP